MKKNKKKDNSVLICFLIALIAVAVIAVVLFTSIDKDDKSEGDSSTADESTVDVGAETEYIPPAETESFGDGEVDPENDELEVEAESGADVKAEELQLEEGRSNGIDVSKWQGKIDWQKVKESGIEFAYIRIGYRGETGEIFKDDNADYNIQQAEKAGILVGVYFFSTATTEAEAREEAQWTAKAIEGYSISYPVVYDCEGYKKLTSRLFGISAGDRTKNAVAFLEEIKNSGYEPMFYVARNDILTNLYWKIDDISVKYKVWIAQYPATTYPEIEKPEYSGRADAWQYTDKGKVDGIEGNVDMVVCYFERELASPKNESERPADATAPLTNEEKLYTEVNEEVTAKELTNLRSAATTKSDVVATLKNGEIVTRIGVGSNGWSKLIYNGQMVYAITSYLTTDLTPVTTAPETETKEPTTPVTNTPETEVQDDFKAVSDMVTAKLEVNLRTAPTTKSEVVVLLKNGEFVERTGISEKGWSRLIYKGQIVYAVTSYLTGESSTDVEETTATAETEPVSDGFKAVEEKVTAKNATNLRTAPTTTDSEVVYTLPNGEYVERIGIHPNGWSKLLYNGQIVYAVSSYLITEAEDTTVVEETTETVVSE